MADVARPPLRASVLRDLLLAPGGPLDRLELVPTTGSTNSDLAAAVRADPEGWAGRGLYVADHQADGRGRLGRSWETPPRAALTLSVVVWPDLPAATLGWLSLLTGLAAVNAVRATAGVPATLKWPNDLLVPAPDGAVLEGWGDQRKVGGILGEVVTTPRGTALVIGVGLNVSQTPEELPVPSATSLAAVGADDVDREVLLVALVDALVGVAERWRVAAGDPWAAGLVDDLAQVCSTLGRPVRVDLPGGGGFAGVATGFARDGSLVVVDPAGTERTVVAGDVQHLRTPA